MIVLLSIETIPAVLSVVTAALLMVITGCVRSMEEAYQKINWEPVLLIAAMLGIMQALDNTGGVRLISDSFVLFFGNIGPYGLLASFFIYNDAASLIYSLWSSSDYYVSCCLIMFSRL